MGVVTEVIALASGNIATIKISSTDEPSGIDFVSNGVTSMRLSFGGYTLTSAESALSFSDGGIITLDLGQWCVNHGVPVGIYTGYIKAYDPSNLDGVMIVSPSVGTRLTLKVVEE